MSDPFFDMMINQILSDNRRRSNTTKQTPLPRKNITWQTLFFSWLVTLLTLILLVGALCSPWYSTSRQQHALWNTVETRSSVNAFYYYHSCDNNGVPCSTDIISTIGFGIEENPSLVGFYLWEDICPDCTTLQSVYNESWLLVFLSTVCLSVVLALQIFMIFGWNPRGFITIFPFLCCFLAFTLIICAVLSFATSLPDALNQDTRECQQGSSSSSPCVNLLGNHSWSSKSGHISGSMSWGPDVGFWLAVVCIPLSLLLLTLNLANIGKTLSINGEIPTTNEEKNDSLAGYPMPTITTVPIELPLPSGVGSCLE